MPRSLTSCSLPSFDTLTVIVMNSFGLPSSTHTVSRRFPRPFVPPGPSFTCVAFTVTTAFTFSLRKERELENSVP